MSMEDVSRRTVLKRGAAASVILVGGTAVSGRMAPANKRGGRGQFEGELRQNEPFTISSPGTVERRASCMAEESASQTYLRYEIDYCGSDDDTDGTLYVLPDEADLAPGDVYEIHSVIPCREGSDGARRVAFGPANESC